MYQLLQKFEATFSGNIYRSRVSNTGDIIASYLYEDLLALSRSMKLSTRINTKAWVVNTSNKIKGKKGRRGDGTFGPLVPSVTPHSVESYQVARGPVANLEIGTEVKILCTKMTAQIDRVVTDLSHQAAVFREHNRNSIKVAIVGVNHADEYLNYEGERTYAAKKAPRLEAADIVSRLERSVRSEYDELLILRFKATNKPPFLFQWVDESDTRELYSSALVRISHEYDSRF